MNGYILMPQAWGERGILKNSITENFMLKKLAGSSPLPLATGLNVYVVKFDPRIIQNFQPSYIVSIIMQCTEAGLSVSTCTTIWNDWTWLNKEVIQLWPLCGGCLRMTQFLFRHSSVKCRSASNDTEHWIAIYVFLSRWTENYLSANFFTVM